MKAKLTLRFTAWFKSVYGIKPYTHTFDPFDLERILGKYVADAEALGANVQDLRELSDKFGLLPF